MSERYDARLDDVERRLANRAALAAPPGHRDRVLAAVRDTLAGRISPPVAPAGIDSGGMAALVARALSVMVVAVVPWLVVARAVAPVPTEPRIVAQARAAVDDVDRQLSDLVLIGEIAPQFVVWIESADGLEAQRLQPLRYRP